MARRHALVELPELEEEMLEISPFRRIEDSNDTGDTYARYSISLDSFSDDGDW